MLEVHSKSRSVLAHRAKSFNWAGKLLPVETLNKCAVIYSFCRYVDDAADENSAPQAKILLKDIENELRGQSSPREIIRELKTILCDITPALELIEGVRSDLNRSEILDLDELIRYCYLVAGTVGLMMCQALRITDQNAKIHATSMGVAMQLTNICRDVKEDQLMNRCYIPRSLRRSNSDVVLDFEMLKTCIRQLLVMAERYYQFGRAGLHHIPKRERIAIASAANLYQEIGREILRQNYPVLEKRVHVSTPKKIFLVVKSIFQVIFDLH